MDFFKNIWKAVKFAASATIGIPCAFAATAFVGSAYLLAEATNVVEAKVRKSFGGQEKSVWFNPFYKGISDSLHNTLNAIWSDYGVYAHITCASYLLSKTKRDKYSLEDSEYVKAEGYPPKDASATPTTGLNPTIDPDPIKNPLHNNSTQSQTTTPILDSNNVSEPIVEDSKKIDVSTSNSLHQTPTLTETNQDSPSRILTGPAKAIELGDHRDNTTIIAPG